MTDAELQAVVERALLRVADNVAKHVIGRSGWSPDDKCFVCDLRASRDEVMGLVRAGCADVPALVAEVRRLRRENAALWDVIVEAEVRFNVGLTGAVRRSLADGDGEGRP